ncbi:MAG: redox-regulated ATPase YchF [Eubacteriales bacterium]|nr:redox-regulated ATPase YchF [Eubacteriales bacterium]
MKIGLIGMPASGKTALYSLLTNTPVDSAAAAGKTASTGIAKVPDDRIDFLTSIYKPKRTIYATIEVTDIKGFAAGGAGGVASANPFLEAVRQVDALVHVVRAFHNEEVFHVEGSINPIRDIETINTELLFSDLSIVENRIERIQTSHKVTKEMAAELEVLKKCRAALEEGRLINSIGLSEEENQLLRTFSFLTERPLVILMNLDEQQFRSGSYDQKKEVMQYAAERNIPLIDICVETELEINQLPEDDRPMFMEDLGIKETGIGRLAKVMYNYLGLISFLTMGEDEVRAWPIRKGIAAKPAGGKVHTDIERGFIRAEIISFDDFKSVGSLVKAKEKGLLRLEGKDYIMQDGDIVNFRFNV